MARIILLSVGLKYGQDQSSGKHKFANRIFPYFRRHNIEIVPRDQPCDVHLTFNGVIKPNCINIYRLDGVWINRAQDYAQKNKQIISGIIGSRGIIFQSEFCETVTRRMFYKVNIPKCRVIYNGADPDEFQKDPAFQPSLPSFIAMCKWRPHKRLKYIVDGFLRSSVSNKTLLHVCGVADYVVEHPNIIYHGWSADTHKILPWCIGSVHLSYLDWCPNAVIESLTAGVPVIYASSGGSPYIIKDSGYSIKDQPWNNRKPIYLYDDHKLDLDEVAGAYDKCYTERETRPPINRPDLHIEKIATQYVNFIKEFL